MARASLLTVFLLTVVLCLPAVAKLIPDGSFEDRTSGTGWTSGISGWSVSPSTASSDMGVGLFFSVNGFTAQDGQVFAGLTNTTVGSGSGRALISSSFDINNERLRFQYVYVTKNQPGDTTHKDPFTVTLITQDSDQQPVAVYTYSVSDVDDSDLGIGTVGASPWGGSGYTYDTGWRAFNIDTTALKGTTATLIFQVDDTASGGGVTGVFLDGVEQIPEPSTFALFGLGILGLGLYSRRRRAQKKS
jgi:hypothetical protein